MSETPRKTKQTQAPPQLIGILAAAIDVGATAFRLEPNLPLTMASFAAGSQAQEIDFEAWSGREMMDYLAAQVTDTKTKTGVFRGELDGKRYACHVALDRTRSQEQAEVTWT